MQRLKKIYNAIVRPAKLALLDYAIQPSPVYSKQQPHDALHQQIAANNNHYAQLLKTVLHYQQQFITIPINEGTDHTVAAWKNGFFPGLDMVMLYSLLATLQPKRYVEIGSGTSTKIAAKTKTEQQLSFSITCIDPSPRNEIKAVADECWI